MSVLYCSSYLLILRFFFLLPPPTSYLCLSVYSYNSTFFISSLLSTFHIFFGLEVYFHPPVDHPLLCAIFLDFPSSSSFFSLLTWKLHHPLSLHSRPLPHAQSLIHHLSFLSASFRLPLVTLSCRHALSPRKGEISGPLHCAR